jgi:hypothetical protein
MTIEMTCPPCGSHDISKNGTTRRGKQNDKCRDCHRQFVEDPQWKSIRLPTFIHFNRPDPSADCYTSQKVPFLLGTHCVTQTRQNFLHGILNVLE